MSDKNSVHIFELHGREYIFHKLSATKGVVLLTRLTRLFGDSLVRLIVGGAGNIKPTNEQVTAQALDQLAAKLAVFDKLQDDDILALARMVFPYVWIGNERIYTGGNDIEIDAKFQGYELDMLPVLWGAISYNLGPLFEGMRQRFPGVLSEATSLRQ